jgi:hypothetical protein
MAFDRDAVKKEIVGEFNKKYKRLDDVDQVNDLILKLVDITHETYLRGTLDGAENYSQIVLERKTSKIIKDHKAVELEKEKEKEKLGEVILKILEGINDKAQTVDDLEPEKPEDEKRCGNCRFMSGQWCNRAQQWAHPKCTCGCWAERECEHKLRIDACFAPCPCCSSKNVKFNARIPERSFFQYFVRCENCGLSGPFRESYREAAEAWRSIEYGDDE